MEKITVMLSAQTAEGMIKIMIFFTALMLFLWGMNTAKHIKRGWTAKEKIFDIAGIILISAMLVLFIIPLFQR